MRLLKNMRLLTRLYSILRVHVPNIVMIVLRPTSLILGDISLPPEHHVSVSQPLTTKGKQQNQQ